VTEESTAAASRPSRRRALVAVLVVIGALAATAAVVTWKSSAPPTAGSGAGANPPQSAPQGAPPGAPHTPASGAPGASPSAPAAAGETQPVIVSGATLAPLPDGAGPTGDPAVGKPMPDLRGASFDGRPVAIAKDGHPKLIVFLAHWCPHCQGEVPRLVAWLGAARLPAGLEVYAVATAVDATRPNYPPSEWLRRERWPAPVLADDARGTAADAAGLSAFPFFVFVGADDRVAGRRAGSIGMEEIEQQLGRLARAR